MTADDIIAELGLAPHPEGGWYRQTWVAEGEGRASGTCIYFLLQKGERSHWHRVDAVEIWHFYAGAPLILRMAEADRAQAMVLGPHLEKVSVLRGCACELVAVGGDDGGLDAGWLHGQSGVSVRGVRTGTAGV